MLKKWMIYSLLITLSLLMNSCESLSPTSSGSSKRVVNTEAFKREEAFLTQLESLMTAKNYQQVSEKVADFFKSNPQAYHWYALMFYDGIAKEGLEAWSGAVAIYQQIVDRSFNREMEFVALAFYRRAYCFEVLLENEKALASLADAAKLQAYLPLEVSLAEIPARIASLHARFQQTALSDLYTRKAERGIQKLKALRRNSNVEWIGKSLVKMGSLSLTQIDEESFRQNMVTLRRNQRYLIQAIELNHPLWSIEAQKLLLSHYTNLWNFIVSYKAPKTVDWEIDLVQESNKKSEFLSLYLESLDSLKNYEAPTESSAYLQTAIVYNQIKGIESQAVTLLSEELLRRPWNAPTDRPQRVPSSENANISESSSPALKPKASGRNNEGASVDPFKNLEVSDGYIHQPLPKKKNR